MTTPQPDGTTKSPHVMTQPNGRPAVFCGNVCGILAVALVNDKPLCIKCLRKKLSLVSINRVRIQPITEAFVDGEDVSDESAHLFPFAIELHV